MEYINNLGRELLNFDIFSKSPLFLFNGSHHYKTLFGGIISSLVNGFFIIFVIFISIQESTHQNQNVLSLDLAYTDSNTILKLHNNYNYNNHSPNYNSSVQEGLFYWYFTFRNSSDGKLIPLENINKIFNITVDEVQQNANKLSLIKSTYNTNIPCNNIQFFTVEDNSLCNNISTLDLICDKTCLSYTFYEIRINKCQGNTNCYPDDQINQLISSIEVNFNYIDFKNNYTKTGNNLYVDFFINTIKKKISTKILETTEIYLSGNKYFSEESIFSNLADLFEWSPVKVTTINSKFKNSEFATLLIFNIQRNYKYLYNYRYYKNIYKIILEIFAVWIVLKSVGYLITYHFNYEKYLLDLGNKMFSLVDPKIEKKIRKYDFDFIMENKHSDKYPLFNTMIKLNNKSQLECQICIKYFSKERCQGIDFQFKDYLYIIFCNGRFNRVKSKIIQYSKNQVLKTIDIKKSFEFQIQLNNLLKGIMGDKKDLLLCGNSRTISVDKITHFEEMFKKNDEFESLDNLQKSLYKESYFLEGLRSMKYRPFLDEKIDVDLIKLFNIDYNILQNYFLQHRHYFDEEKKQSVIKSPIINRRKKRLIKKIKLQKISQIERFERSNTFEDILPSCHGIINSL